MVSQKSQYTLRAIFELSRHHGEGPVKISAIAAAQAIPPKFLEVILNRLKQAGIVESRRGSDGGYNLAGSPEEITVGDILRLIEGSMDPVSCVSEGSKKRCPLYGSCVFLSMWKEIKEAVSKVYDNMTFKKLLENEWQNLENTAFTYTI